MDTQDGFIVGVYNYCDRWCERCALTARCRVFAEEQRLSFEIPAAPAATPAQATDQAQSPVHAQGRACSRRRNCPPPPWPASSEYVNRVGPQQQEYFQSDRHEYEAGLALKSMFVALKK